jgi:hypothetical protein
VTLLSASLITVLGAGAWWWVTWPQRTAREFVHRLGSSDNEPLLKMLRPTKDVWRLRLMKQVRPKSYSQLKPQPRSFRDFCIGRQEFRTAGEFGWQFTAERGVVTRPSMEYLKPVFQRISQMTVDELEAFLDEHGVLLEQ